LTTIGNPPELKLGQEVLHGDLQSLHSTLADMNTLTPHIKELMEFQNRLIGKLKLENSPSLESVLDQPCL
jgi:hypothetical protein